MSGSCALRVVKEVGASGARVPVHVALLRYPLPMCKGIETVKAVMDAWNAMVLRTAVLLVPSGDPVAAMGSGVLLQSEKGTPFVITARHNFEDEERATNWWRPTSATLPALDSRPMLDAAEDVRFGPEASGRDEPIDVAVVRLRETLHSIHRPLAAPVAVVAYDDEIGPRQLTVSADFPRSFGYFHDRMHYLQPPMTLMTEPRGHDSKGRLQFDWSEGLVTEESPLPHPNFRAGELVALGDQQGISGGAVWRISAPSSGELWSPTSHANLIGIACSRKGETQFAESVAAWREWLLSSIDWIDAAA